MMDEVPSIVLGDDGKRNSSSSGLETQLDSSPMTYRWWDYPLAKLPNGQVTDCVRMRCDHSGVDEACDQEYLVDIGEK